MNDPRVEATFKRSRHKNLSIFIISQDYYELLIKTVRANGSIYHIFKPNNFLDVRSTYQDKASMDITLDEFKYITSTCWNEKRQPLTLDMTKDQYQGRYRPLTFNLTKDRYQGRHRLGLNSIFVPDSSPF